MTCVYSATRCSCTPCNSDGSPGPPFIRCNGQPFGTPVWDCEGSPALSAPCPSTVPNRGAACSLPTTSGCPAGTCGDLNVVCDGGVWRWSYPAVTCPACVRQCATCASPGTPIATPTGERPIGGLPSPEAAHTFTGSNGTFANRCDEAGSLIAYQCETTLPPCDPAFNGCSFISPILTGKVVPYQDSAIIDCEGHCHDNRCDGRCPQQGDQLTLVRPDANGNVIIHNDTDGRTYSCMPDPDSQNRMSFDCHRSPAGQTGYVAGLGLFVSDGFCTGKNIGNIAMIVDGAPTSQPSESCTYLSCSIVPAPSCSP
jgi:hypothetical protein